ncbi:MAG TPA: ParB/RepB/Spo0J family partition protein [Gemmatales bacterium]|nr:ParB/RepB/Spo0J family partition protein [Gemmatales bacterium]
MKSMNIEEVKISQIEVGERYRKDYGDLLPLQVSIETLGLLQPIGITVGMQLVYGGRRLQAFKNLKRKTIPCVVVDFDNLLLAENDENDDEIRKSFTPSEKLAIARKLEEVIGERRGNPSIVKSAKNCTNGKEPKKGQKTRDHVAEKAGFGNHETMSQMEKVEAGCSPDVLSEVNEGGISISDAASIAGLPHDVQDAALSKVTYGAAKTLKKAAEIVQQEREADAGLAEVVRDCNGIVIPDHVLPIYDEVAQFNEIIELAKQLRMKINAVEKTKTWHSPRGQLGRYLQTIAEHMKAEQFWCVCPACNGELEVECGICCNRRWFWKGNEGTVNFEKYLKAS